MSIPFAVAKRHPFSYIFSSGNIVKLQGTKFLMKKLRMPEFFATDPEVPGSIPGLVSTIEELLGRRSSGSGLERREYGRKDPLC
jgi:hypothetical protein